MPIVARPETPHDALRRTAELLAAAYTKARDDLAREINENLYPFEPEQARDHNGRYILLDALTALAQAQATLAATELHQGG
ncbi:hypothetical protein ACGFNU_21360 [Spirillospora sp. NPDC048911]|uniref:hypothetical protein n=1 Tax=Spirillospora sp. NPDC048911 TaxID=3364527 RepID=UPI003716B81D